MARRGYQLGFLGVVFLVLLRITVGWHFLYQGLWKLENPEFASEGFLAQARGPLADKFHALIPDFEGTERTTLAYQEKQLDAALAAFTARHALDESQKTQAAEVRNYYRDQIAAYLGDAERAQAIADARHEWDRLRADKAKWSPLAGASPENPLPASDEIAQRPWLPPEYVQKQHWDKQTELRAQANGWIADLDKYQADFAQALTGVLTSEQRAARGDGYSPLAQFLDTFRNLQEPKNFDRFIIYTNIAIGACLMVGFLTRFSALCGGLFMALIVAAQPDWPGLYPHPHPIAGHSLFVTKEFIEMMVLFTLATTGVGRWGGLDFFVRYLITDPLFGRNRED